MCLCWKIRAEQVETWWKVGICCPKEGKRRRFTLKEINSVRNMLTPPTWTWLHPPGGDCSCFHVKRDVGFREWSGPKPNIWSDRPGNESLVLVYSDEPQKVRLLDSFSVRCGPTSTWWKNLWIPGSGVGDRTRGSQTESSSVTTAKSHAQKSLW